MHRPRYPFGSKRTGASPPGNRLIPIRWWRSVKAYVNALNRLIERRKKTAPGENVKSVHYKDA